MEWLKQRGSAINAAWGAKRYMLLPLIAAVITFVDWVATRLAETGMEPLIGVPSWAVGIFAAVLLGGWWILEYAVKLQKQLNPKLRLSFKSDGPGLVRTPEKKRDDEGSPIEEFEAIYIRVGVESASRQAVPDCTPMLVNITKKVGGNFVPTAFTDPMELPWSLRGVGAIQIPHDVTRYFDILRTTSKDGRLKFVSPWPLTLRNFFDDNTTYRLRVVCVGAGVSESLEIDVNWIGDWDRIDVSEVDRGDG